MNTRETPPITPEPLTPEERALASRLVRLGPHREPGPELDANILRAARAAARQPAPRHQGWPAWVGIAATLALAVGVTWQMRPTGESPVRVDAIGQPTADFTAAADASSAPAAPAATGAAGPSTQRGAAAQDSAPPPGRQAQRQESEPSLVPVPASAPPAAKAVQAPAEEPVIAMPAPPPPPPPPAAPMPESAPAPSMAMPMPATQAAEAAAAIAQKREAMSRRMRDSSGQEDAMSTLIDDTTAPAAAAVAFPAELADLPVAQDTQLEPAAWLERIRQRRDAGDASGARDSLRALLRLHPDAVVPDDLRTLADDRTDPR